MKTKLLTLLLAIVASIGIICASNTQVDGIWYDFNNSTQTATVTYRGSGYTSYSDEYFGSVMIPSSVTYNNVVYSVTSIGSSAFNNCTGLTSVTIPNSVTSIGDYAFFGCPSLTSINVDANNPNYCSIDGVLFNKDNTTLITCPGGKQGAYSIPNSVTSIREGAFYVCTRLTSIEIPSSVTSIGGGAFYWCHSLNSIMVESGNTIYDSRDNCNAIIITAANQLISGCKSSIIPNSVTSIGEYAFRECTRLTSIEIPNSVTSIGEHAFQSCTGLTSVTIPNSVTSIGSIAFNNCTGLTSVTIPNSVTSIGERAFSGCSGLTSVTMGNGVTSIGTYAFSGCTSLTSVYISDFTAWCAIGFGNYVANPLYNAHNLYLNETLVTDLVIPDGVTSIGNYAFYGCSGLTSVTIPNSVTSIGERAFSGCSGLTSVTIESNSIMSKNYTYSSNLKHIFGTQVAEYIIGNSVTSIGECAFCECSNLISITIPNSIASIGNSAFQNCRGLTSLTIPNSVTSIGNMAFLKCSSLTSVTIETETPPTLGTSTFSDTNNCPIYIPCGTLEAYQSAWPTYESQIQYAPLPYTIVTNSNITEAGNVIVPQHVCDSNITAVPNYGYHFVQWNDGNTENPRTIVVTRDTTFTAEFAVAKSGVCGEENALRWAYTEDKTLTISGSGALTENYTFGLEAPQEAQHIVIGDDVTAVGDSAFYNMATIESVSFGNNVTSIGNFAFAGLNNRKFNILKLPAGLLTIGNSSFEGCSYLESIDFGRELESIGEKAFYDCTRVLSMVCLAQITPEVGNYGLTSISSQAELYVLKDCLQKYKVDNNWNRFIIKEYEESQGIDNIYSSSPQGEDRGSLILRDGQILILRGEKVYTLTGTEVK